MVITTALEIQFKLAAHGRAQAVEELAEVRAAGVVLHVARIEMVSDVENDDAGARLLIQERNFEAFQDGRVQRQKPGKREWLRAPTKSKRASMTEKGKPERISSDGMIVISAGAFSSP